MAAGMTLLEGLLEVCMCSEVAVEGREVSQRDCRLYTDVGQAREDRLPPHTRSLCGPGHPVAIATLLCELGPQDF
ncbi:hypothetical protein BDW22DRAFT_1360238 [Trametopsis cervina]|nr:hypothetical protein BDW22DRAFT_1360238 [Trametopsis cervina]